jgi:predicted Zn-ribbon and HTH transcriptional regulator
MRTSLLHPRSDERRHLRRRRSRRAGAIPATDAVASDVVETTRERAERHQVAATADTVARQVRAAGGPLDQATYSCQCGYVFAASVTTSVSCPHCGEAQAW